MNIRETQEEICITPIDYEKVGYINFDVWYKGERTDLKLNIYTCTKYEGEIQETEEMRPVWFEKDKLPFDKMLEDDMLWLPMVLDGKKVTGSVKFDQNLHMEYNTIHAVDELSEMTM